MAAHTRKVQVPVRPARKVHTLARISGCPLDAEGSQMTSSLGCAERARAKGRLVSSLRLRAPLPPKGASVSPTVDDANKAVRLSSTCV